MPSFDGHSEGTPLEVWYGDGRIHRIPVLPPRTLGTVDRLLVVVAHADDETLGCGGTIALARRVGTPVEVVIVTDGAAAHGEASSSLAAQRREEAQAALAELGGGIALTFLDVPDEQTPTHRDWIATHVRRRGVGPAGRILFLSTWAGDGHRDHQVVGEVCAEIARQLRHPLFAAPIWLWHWAWPDWARMPWNTLVRVELDDELRMRKSAALRRYPSQTGPGPAGQKPLLHPQFVRLFQGDDRLVRVV
ncbi:PIG-L deacetylase family protein [Rathayibacter toxicus]|uniref:PIG-L family deacetylase n=2 Tax=Rathayibacter toxicus TaxID=145458 RepID=A0A2S5Y599_9MICO|nr:PIG-L deacetylase family protein [Rathayibacter toxicus]ALS57613.1 hypothetical protein APU90_07415 [Rathayibacter toxicus]PPG20716.1 PIG-L family deacetylase [Rathayibacter toxicus]PPG45820.1 PIG-L family deacetylase [Rathayibacter toxicus]PPH21763.1 PIG-L family deacetylase [Rathayibacter toxicus]PPH56192.1 PIG-L family deacetylase [Rathayibacter toxicus]